MSYVDALLVKDQDKILVVERKNGKRVYVEYPSSYIFYYDDPKGKYRTIYDTPVSRVFTRQRKEFQKELRIHNNVRTWESDFNPVFRCLSEHYRHVDSPRLHTAFFDIESDFDQEKGFGSIEDPFTSITAITVYLDWLDQLITLAMPPKTMTFLQGQAVAEKFDNTFVFDDEVEMLNTFLSLIEDADVLSGWNSEGYDIPYIVNRMCKIMSKDDTRRLCLWDQLPKQRTYERFGAEHITYDLVGRVHMDYMQLYRKYTYEERHSYSLNAIGEYELGEHKTQYDGTLDQLYNNDFQKFIEYNRQDVALLAKLDQKLKFLDLANEIAHDNTVLLQTTMGAVAVTEQAIINECHDRGLIVPDRKRTPKSANLDEEETEGAVGAYVAYPKKGLHDYIGAIDINSLYPSAIRMLNMGPETIIGQLRPELTDTYISGRISQGMSFAKAWEGLFGTLEYQAVMEKNRAIDITVDWENGTSQIMSGAEIHAMIWDQNLPLMLSANGTLFTSEQEGIIPGLLSRWYTERKELQKKKAEAITKEDIAFWDKRQLVKKINLNSLYGALLNPGCRFNDKRIGQSTTLSGRTIAKHMNAYVNQCITGEYNHTGEAIIYSDTDSSYFSAWPTIKQDVDNGQLNWDKDVCVKLYDTIADQVNDSFPGMCFEAFHSPNVNGKLIRCGRELVASKGLYITKKRYAVVIYDLEGKRLDHMSQEDSKKKGIIYQVGKLKAMGLDLKRADTPKFVQDFLIDILTDLLTGKDQSMIIDKISQFKQEFRKRPAWEKGSPKRVNNLTHYRALEAKKGKANLPGHVRASLNWNTLRDLHKDKRSIQIVDGMKVIVCKLKNNPIGYTSVAYPTDELRLPAWFKELPFDQDEMENAVVDGKIENLLNVLNWDLHLGEESKNTYSKFF